MSAIEGIDRHAIMSWLAARVDALEPPLTFTLIEGGRSNLTYRVEDVGGRRWVLRRPPLQGVLPSAHDMAREHRIISSLWGSPVPVPRTIGYEPDRSVTGAPFYVMDLVEGRVIRDAQAASTQLARAERGTVADSLVDVLVALHTIEPDEVGLGDLGRKENYLARQLRRWHGQLTKSQESGGREVRVLDEAHERLTGNIPPQEAVAIVHGDYRLDNVIVGSEAQVVAVLDWELCTLGDPLADVGLLAVYWSDPDDDTIPLVSAPTALEGFPRREEVIARYGERSGRDLSRLDYYVAFAFWKLAVILEGVHTRFVAGAYGQGGDGSWELLGDNVERLGEAALALLDARSRLSPTAGVSTREKEKRDSAEGP